MRAPTQHCTYLSTMPYHHEITRVKEEDSSTHGETSMRDPVINYNFMLEEQSYLLKLSIIQFLFSFSFSPLKVSSLTQEHWL